MTWLRVEYDGSRQMKVWFDRPAMWGPSEVLLVLASNESGDRNQDNKTFNMLTPSGEHVRIQIQVKKPQKGGGD